MCEGKILQYKLLHMYKRRAAKHMQFL